MAHTDGSTNPELPHQYIYSAFFRKHHGYLPRDFNVRQPKLMIQNRVGKSLYKWCRIIVKFLTGSKMPPRTPDESYEQKSPDYSADSKNSMSIASMEIRENTLQTVNYSVEMIHRGSGGIFDPVKNLMMILHHL